MHLSDDLAVYMFLHNLPTGVEALLPTGVEVLAHLTGRGMFGSSRKVLNNIDENYPQSDLRKD